MFIRRRGRHSERHRNNLGPRRHEKALQELTGLKPMSTQTDKGRGRTHRLRLSIGVIGTIFGSFSALCSIPLVGLEQSATTAESEDVGDTSNQINHQVEVERELGRLLSMNSEPECHRASRTSRFGGVQVQLELGCDGAPRSWTVIGEEEKGVSIH